MTIREEELAKMVQLPVKTVELLLQKAEQRGILDYLQRKGDSSVSYTLARQHDRDLRLDTRLMKEMRDRTVNRQVALFAFLKNDLDCRMAQLLDYFGEQVEEGCGVCDVCQNASSHGESDKGNVMLYALRDSLNEEQDIETIKREFSLHEPKRSQTFRWALDKGFVKIDGRKAKWIGPYLKPQTAQVDE